MGDRLDHYLAEIGRPRCAQLIEQSLSGDYPRVDIRLTAHETLTREQLVQQLTAAGIPESDVATIAWDYTLSQRPEGACQLSVGYPLYIAWDREADHE